MSLGPDNTICQKAFIDAMRPIAGDNVDLPQVKANLGALGLAVYTILIQDAETDSNSTIDAAFWKWVAALDSWQQGVVQAFTNWQPTQPDGLALRTAVLGVLTPQSASAPAPTKLEGKIT